MKKNTDFYLLEQVYNFMNEQPDFKVKKPEQQLFDFLKAIHDDTTRGILIVSADKIIISFRQRVLINIHSAPPVRNKMDFLEWLARQLKI